MYTQRCSRCRKILTDYASMEAGVGPICRSRSNHLYAKLIEANGLIASVNFTRNDLAITFPEECRNRFFKAQNSFIKKFTELQHKNNNAIKLTIKGADFRKEVEALDYLLSFPIPRATREILISIIKDLGYVGLAAVINGEASKSKAKVYFKEGRVFLEGTSCKSGWRKMRHLQGIITPRFRGEKTPFSAPVEECKNFLRIVSEHWPLYEGDLSIIQEYADAYLLLHKNLDKQYRKKDLLARAQIVRRTNDFVLTFEWLKDINIYAMLAEMKSAVPCNGRKYNQNSKSWIFLNKHFKIIEAIVSRRFPRLKVLVDTPIEHTPINLWAKKRKKK